MVEIHILQHGFDMGKRELVWNIAFQNIRWHLLTRSVVIFIIVERMPNLYTTFYPCQAGNSKVIDYDTVPLQNALL